MLPSRKVLEGFADPKPETRNPKSPTLNPNFRVRLGLPESLPPLARAMQIREEGPSDPLAIHQVQHASHPVARRDALYALLLLLLYYSPA